MFRTEVIEKIKTHFMFISPPRRKLYRLWDNVEECGRVRQATDDNSSTGSTVHVHCMLGNKATETHSEFVIPFILILTNLMH